LDGSVGDSSGGRIPGAGVTVRDTAANRMREAPTNAEGAFHIAELPVGTYEVLVSQPASRLTGIPNSVPFANLYNGALVIGQRRAGGRYCLYRWHADNPVAFENYLKHTIEHGHANDGHANDRADCFYSVGYWYQTSPSPISRRSPPLQRGWQLLSWAKNAPLTQGVCKTRADGLPNAHHLIPDSAQHPNA
jgi:hypothetical protein